MEIFNNTYVAEILKWQLLLSAGMILQQLRRILKRLTLVEYKLHAADYALEKSFKNGYEILDTSGLFQLS